MDMGREAPAAGGAKVNQASRTWGAKHPPAAGGAKVKAMLITRWRVSRGFVTIESSGG
jgi:hypothetical protein